MLIDINYMARIWRMFRTGSDCVYPTAANA